jgi:hypothetical protein
VTGLRERLRERLRTRLRTRPGWGAVAIVALACLAASASAIELSVDPAGGPLTLEDDVAAALADWRAAGVDADEVEATVVVRYGDPARFGPDVQVWVLLRGGAEPEDRSFEILVAPAATAVRAALIPAFGVALGGSLGAGAFDPILDPTGPRLPTEAEGDALEARRTAIVGDLTGDGLVGFEDLLLMAASYGRRAVNLAADLNADGVVDAADLDLLRERYTFEPPAAE